MAYAYRAVLACAVLGLALLPLTGEAQGTPAAATNLTEIRSYTELLHGQFFEFFRWSEVKRRRAQAGRTKVQLQPGGHRESISLVVTLDSNDQIESAVLTLARAFVGNRNRANLLANDVAKSFLLELAPAADSADIRAIAAAIWEHRGSDDEVISWGSRQPTPREQSTEASDALDAFTGAALDFELGLSASNLTIKQLSGKPRRVELKIHRYSAPRPEIDPSTVSPPEEDSLIEGGLIGQRLVELARVPETLLGQPYVVVVSRRLTTETQRAPLGARAMIAGSADLLFVVRLVLSSRARGRAALTVSVLDGDAPHAINIEGADPELEFFAYSDPCDRPCPDLPQSKQLLDELALVGVRKSRCVIGAAQLAQTMNGIGLARSEFKNLPRLMEQLRHDKPAVIAEYRARPADDFESSEYRLVSLAIALAKNGQDQRALDVLELNAALRPASKRASRLLAATRASEDARSAGVSIE